MFGSPACFAGGLSEAGLPAGHIPLALALFSAGVEIGHFSFVAAVLAANSRESKGRTSPSFSRTSSRPLIRPGESKPYRACSLNASTRIQPMSPLA